MIMPSSQNRSNCAFRCGLLLLATKPTAKSGLSKINEMSTSQKRRLNFSYDERIEKIVVKVMEGTTEKVIRQIPSEGVSIVGRRANNEGKDEERI